MNAVSAFELFSHEHICFIQYLSVLPEMIKCSCWSLRFSTFFENADTVFQPYWLIHRSEVFESSPMYWCWHLSELWKCFMEPKWDRAVGYPCSVQQGWAGATLPQGVLTRSNLSPHLLFLLPAFIHSFSLLNRTFFLHITPHTLLLLPLPPPAGGVRDGDIWQGSEPILWGEVAGDVSRPKLPWNTWTRVPGWNRKRGKWHRWLWGGLHTA